MGPQTGFTGSAFSMRSNLVGGRFAQNGPQDFFSAFGPFRAPGGHEISPSPPDPQKSSKSRIATAGGRTIESAKCTTVARRGRGSMGQKKLKTRRWRRVTAETAPCQKYMVQPGFEPGTSASLGGGPEKMANTTQRRQSKKVAQRERGSAKQKKSRKLPGGAK